MRQLAIVTVVALVSATQAFGVDQGAQPSQGSTDEGQSFEEYLEQNQAAEQEGQAASQEGQQPEQGQFEQAAPEGSEQQSSEDQNLQSEDENLQNEESPELGEAQPFSMQPVYPWYPDYPGPYPGYRQQVACFVRNVRGQVFTAVGWNARQVQWRAMRQCQYYSFVCFSLGCRAYRGSYW